MDDGTTDDGTMDDGTMDNETMDDGTMDDGTMDDGTMDDVTGLNNAVDGISTAVAVGIRMVIVTTKLLLINDTRSNRRMMSANCWRW